MKLTKSKLKEIIKDVVDESVAMPLGERLNTAIKELDYMISVGPEEDVYDKPKQSVKFIKMARQLLGKVKWN